MVYNVMIWHLYALWNDYHDKMYGGNVLRSTPLATSKYMTQYFILFYFLAIVAVLCIRSQNLLIW